MGDDVYEEQRKTELSRAEMLQKSGTTMHRLSSNGVLLCHQRRRTQTASTNHSISMDEDLHSAKLRASSTYTAGLVYRIEYKSDANVMRITMPSTYAAMCVNAPVVVLVVLIVY